MHKELNPDLFGERRTPKTTSHESGLGASVAETPGFLNVDRQILELKHQVSGVGEEFKKLSSQVQEFMKVSHLKMERLTQQVQRLEHSHNGLVQDSGQKIGQIGHRLAERKNLDQKIQEMVDRHTNVIKSFEVRMNHLQRLLADKEAQAAVAQTALNEAKMELSRLKRL